MLYDKNDEPLRSRSRSRIEEEEEEEAISVPSRLVPLMVTNLPNGNKLIRVFETSGINPGNYTFTNNPTKYVHRNHVDIELAPEWIDDLIAKNYLITLVQDVHRKRWRIFTEIEEEQQMVPTLQESSYSPSDDDPPYPTDFRFDVPIE